MYCCLLLTHMVKMINRRLLLYLTAAVCLCVSCLGLEDPTPVSGHPKDDASTTGQMSIKDALISPDNTQVILEGVVDGVNFRGFVLLDQSDLVYVHVGADWEGDLSNGDRVKLTGNMYTYEGSRLINVSEYELIGKSDIPYHSPAKITSDNIYEFALGRGGACRVEFEGFIETMDGSLSTCRDIYAGNDSVHVVLDYPLYDYSKFVGRYVRIEGYYTGTSEPSEHIPYYRLMISVTDMIEEETVVTDCSPAANCYIITKSGQYQFPSVKGNGDESVGDVSSVEVLWESYGTDEMPAVGSLIRSVSYDADSDKIVFDVTYPFHEGNAVIAAKDATGIILWSWHIWLTDQPGEQVYYNKAGTMMDRNLGATSATPGEVGTLGLLYQWGRKDPFLNSSSIDSRVMAESTIVWPTFVTSDVNYGTIEYSVANPVTLISSNDYNRDWYYTGDKTTDDTRWLTVSRKKSVYDPCPAGWRVPAGNTSGVWAKAAGSRKLSVTYDKTLKGMDFSGIFGDDSVIWYPAAGYLDDEGLVGSGFGTYASCTPESYTYRMYGMYIYNSDLVLLAGEGERAMAHSVRCIQE